MSEKLVFCHMLALLLGFVLDLLIGDPYWMPHPVRLIGRWIDFLDHRLLGGEGRKRDIQKEHLRGVLLVLLVVVPAAAGAAVLQILAYRANLWLGMALETIFTYQLLAAKCLKTESMKVYDRLKEHDLEGARAAVSMIVGRDTTRLDEAGVTRATVESVSENTSDGELAPMFYLAIAGPIGGFFYKAVNTLDSMVGYRNERYQYFGMPAAKLDDWVNFIPARVTAMLMILASYLLGKDFSGKNAWRIFRRDRYLHPSPNSAQLESACAGSLGLCLAGSAIYFGRELQKDTLGDALREIESEDIVRVNRLLYATSFLGIGLFLLLLLVLLFTV